jgi:hypothetical protein
MHTGYTGRQDTQIQYVEHMAGQDPMADWTHRAAGHTGRPQGGSTYCTVRQDMQGSKLYREAISNARQVGMA